MSRVPTIDVIMVCYNHARFLNAFFEGLKTSSYPREAWAVHIVDNASSDGSADQIRMRLLETDEDLPDIYFYPQETNLGFSGGNNLIMKQSQADYVYLLNPDAVLRSETLEEAVRVAESNQQIASVQSLMILAQRPDTLNGIGNDIHFAGFGYCRGYLQSVKKAPTDIKQISYASGAACLIRNAVLKRVGYFDEELFAYHEDLEIGWRFLIAGFENVLAPKSVVLHDYEFSRSISKWYLMERNRSIVVLTMYRWGTILLLLPALLAIEFAVWLFAFKGGWTAEKAKSIKWFFLPSSWKYLFRKRKEISRLRMRRDREILRRFVSGIEHQEVESTFLSSVANPLMNLYFMLMNVLIFW
jgi:GT2 family glycosyltransferase